MVAEIQLDRKSPRPPALTLPAASDAAPLYVWSAAPLSVHPVAELFPLLSHDDLEALADDIETNGQRDPILMYVDQIIDGRNRHAACVLKGIEPKTEQYTGNPADIPALIISKNLHRRHLTTDQRAAIAAELTTMRLGDNQHAGPEGPPNGGPSLPKVSAAAAAKLMNVGERTVERAKHRKRLDPVAHEEAKRGDRPKKASTKSSTTKPSRRPTKPKVVTTTSEPIVGVDYVFHEIAGFTHRIRFPSDVLKWFHTEEIEEIACWLVNVLRPDRTGDLVAALSAPVGREGAQ